MAAGLEARLAPLYPGDHPQLLPLLPLPVNRALAAAALPYLDPIAAAPPPPWLEEGGIGGRGSGRLLVLIC
jgi:hypothetical protein